MFFTVCSLRCFRVLSSCWWITWLLWNDKCWKKKVLYCLTFRQRQSICICATSPWALFNLAGNWPSSLLVKADIRFTDINTLNFPVFIWKFFTFGSVGNNDITFPRCSLKKIFVRLKMNYLTSIQVMYFICRMSREIVKGERFQEIYNVTFSW